SRPRTPPAARPPAMPPMPPAMPLSCSRPRAWSIRPPAERAALGPRNCSRRLWGFMHTLSCSVSRQEMGTRGADGKRNRRSDRLPRRVAGGPGPLEIVAAEPAGDVQALADEVEAGHLFRLEGLGGNLVGIDPAGGH